jgi:hypothetical protein
MVELNKGKHVLDAQVIAATFLNDNGINLFLIVFISGPSHLSYLGLKIEVNQVW